MKNLENQANQSAILTSSDQQELEKVLQVIHTSHLEITNMETLEKKSGVERKVCDKLFRKYMKTTPTEYLREYRVKIACQLLEETNLSITEISKLCGIQNSYLSAKIRAVTGYTPLLYRWNYLRNKMR